MIMNILFHLFKVCTIIYFEKQTLQTFLPATILEANNFLDKIILEKKKEKEELTNTRARWDPAPLLSGEYAERYLHHRAMDRLL